MNTNKKNPRALPLSLLCITIVFSILAYFVDRKEVGPEDTSVGFSTLNSAFAKAFPYNSLMDTVSDVVMYLAFLVVAVFAVTGLVQLIKNKSISKVTKSVLCLGALYIVVVILYVAFDKIPINYRPIIQPGETELETSFPSTHTLVICTVLGSAMIAVKDLLKNEKTVKLLRILAVILMVVGVGARLFAGVHWATDIIAGMLFSATLVSVYAAWIAE